MHQNMLMKRKGYWTKKYTLMLNDILSQKAMEIYSFLSDSMWITELKQLSQVDTAYMAQYQFACGRFSVVFIFANIKGGLTHHCIPDCNTRGSFRKKEDVNQHTSLFSNLPDRNRGLGTLLQCVHIYGQPGQDIWMGINNICKWRWNIKKTY